MSKPYSYIFFDLDGTLTDSGPGIMNGFAYAVEKMGGQVTDKTSFCRFVGPPLRDSFEKDLGYKGDDTDKAIAFYRDYYFNQGGALENTVYPGIEMLLSELKTAGKTLVVATSKNVRGTTLVLEHFGLNKYFDFVATSNDTDRKNKSDVIRYAIESYGITDLGCIVMVGDRENDVSAANEVGIDSIGVLYGYGDLEELTKAGATYIAATPEDVKSFID
ncbi:MAG: HAD-IA family hydrolase [Clostridiales bacterium]|nr:HAD-IA family hydrolase [Clostridiales bacterium]